MVDTGYSNKENVRSFVRMFVTVSEILFFDQITYTTRPSSRLITRPSVLQIGLMMRKADARLYERVYSVNSLWRETSIGDAICRFRVDVLYSSLYVDDGHRFCLLIFETSILPSSRIALFVETINSSFTYAKFLTLTVKKKIQKFPSSIFFF